MVNGTWQLPSGTLGGPSFVSKCGQGFRCLRNAIFLLVGILYPALLVMSYLSIQGCPPWSDYNGFATQYSLTPGPLPKMGGKAVYVCVCINLD